MPETVGVRFHGAGKTYTFLAGEMELNVGDAVIVSTQQGMSLGVVAEPRTSVAEEVLPPEIQPILRIATEEDRKCYDENREYERQAFAVAREKIENHGLEMRLVDVECSFDRSKMLFYFTAEGRVDFRALVRDLAQEFRMRIELRQIGVRDEARMVGGLGVCGRSLCCASWMRDFIPVSIKMAKEQSLSMNPGKISGCCGRLLCCLKYEQETYEEMRKALPKLGAIIQTPRGKAKVESLKILQECCICRLLDVPEETIVLSAEEWAALRPSRRDEGGRSDRSERRRRRSQGAVESAVSADVYSHVQTEASSEAPAAVEEDCGQGGSCCRKKGGCCHVVSTEVTPPTPRGETLDVAVREGKEELHDGNFIENIESV